VVGSITRLSCEPVFRRIYIGHRAPSNEGTLTPEARNDWGVTDQDFNNGSHLAGAASHIFFEVLQERLYMEATLFFAMATTNPSLCAARMQLSAIVTIL